MIRSAKQYAITGSWRTASKQVEKDVRKVVRDIINQGGRIAVGGALGVDYFVVDEVLKYGDPKTQLKLFLPVPLERFIEHYYRRARQKIITEEQVRKITSQLEEIASISPNSISDKSGFTVVNERSYSVRDTKIIEYGKDGFYAFQVNDSKGVGKNINNALKKIKQIYVKKYDLKEKEYKSI